MYLFTEMSRFRLRYGSTNVELARGTFTIGRSSGCNLAIADNLVSRRHAALHVGSEEVVVEDIGSRNGLMVNGKPQRGRCRLKHMDRIYIGARELVLIDGGRVTERPDAALHVICDACGAVNGSVRRRCGECGRRLDGVGAATHKEPPKFSAQPHAWGDPVDTQTETSRDVIDGIAAKAIELGRFEEAERILLPHLDRLKDRAIRGVPLSSAEEHDPDVLLRKASVNALGLARGLRAKKWIDWVFRVYAAAGRLMPTQVIESLHNAIRACEYHERQFVRAYLEVIELQTRKWDADERFRIQRLRGLADVIGASR